MTSAIKDLKKRLDDSQRQMFPNGQIFDDVRGVDLMHKVVADIRKKMGDRPAVPPKARICSALNKLRVGGASSLDGMEFYFACWGLTERCGTHGPLIEEEGNLAKFLNEAKRRKITTLPWQGLLDGYFRYTPEAGSTGEKHWRQLRAWLSVELPLLRRRIPPALLDLPWLNVLDDNPGLLSDDPCRRYAAKALQGDRTQIDRIKSSLDLPEISWFWRRLVLSQVDEVTGYRDDARFKSHLDNLITQLREHPAVVDDGVAKLLTRYAASTDRPDRPVHEGLKLLALETWGNPQLERQAKWGLVEMNVREMVSQWLVLEDLRDFFELLQADHAADQRRLDFWLNFIKQISFSHIVLGSHIWRSRDKDWLTFKSKKKGRISRLEGGDANKNAFIMKIGQFYFVEFGETGDACYGYQEHNEPFRLGIGLLQYPGDLKDKERRIFWGRHVGQEWERRFLQELVDLGIRTD